MDDYYTNMKTETGIQINYAPDVEDYDLLKVLSNLKENA